MNDFLHGNDCRKKVELRDSTFTTFFRSAIAAVVGVNQSGFEAPDGHIGRISTQPFSSFLHLLIVSFSVEGSPVKNRSMLHLADLANWSINAPFRRMSDVHAMKAKTVGCQFPNSIVDFEREKLMTFLRRMHAAADVAKPRRLRPLLTTY